MARVVQIKNASVVVELTRAELEVVQLAVSTLRVEQDPGDMSEEQERLRDELDDFFREDVYIEEG